MSHLPDLIADLALILTVAAIVGLIFRWLKQPLILGYLVAGVLVGPHTSLLPTVTDVKGIQIWAEIGVIFLLFSLGLEFGWSKLKRVGPAALITGLFEVTAMFTAGYLLGKVLGWQDTTSLFLGAILTISSTSIIIKTFEEYNLKGKKFADMVFGVLIIEDLCAIVILVALTTLSISHQFEGAELLFEGSKLIFFLVTWFVVGVFAIPWLLGSIKKYLNSETILIFSLGLCFLLVVIATKLGFSSALGAFLMGSILGESDEKKKIESLLHPVKDLFAAIFFVSVGVMLDLNTLSESPHLWISMLVILVLGKMFFITTGALIAGQDEKTATKMGLSMTQIGEFSFIIASLGLSLKLTDSKLYSAAILVSVITSFTTPYLIKHRDLISNIISKMIPNKAHQFIRQYMQLSFITSSRSEWNQLIRSYVIKIGINSVIIILISNIVSKGLVPALENSGIEIRLSNLLAILLTFALASPFLWAIVFSLTKDEVLKLFWETQVHPRLKQFLLVVRISIATILTTVIFAQFLDFKYVALIILLAIAILGYLFSQKLSQVYLWFENRFLGQLQKPDSETTYEESIYNKIQNLSLWDAHLTEVTIPPESSHVGRQLLKLGLREKFGIIIALIQRGKHIITAPGRDDVLMPNDKVYIIGSDAQIENFQRFLEFSKHTQIHQDIDNYQLQQHYVTKESPFIGRIIRDSGIRELASGLVVGIERDGNRILNPESNLEIKEGDLLWLVGDSKKIRSL